MSHLDSNQVSIICQEHDLISSLQYINHIFCVGRIMGRCHRHIIFWTGRLLGFDFLDKMLLCINDDSSAGKVLAGQGIVLDKRWQLCRQSGPMATVFGRSCCNGSRNSTKMIPTDLVSISEWCWFYFNSFNLTKFIDYPKDKMRMHPRTLRV